MLRLSLVLYLVHNIHYISAECDPVKDWWRETFIYQIYPRSFQDSDGDGIGDLNGITNRLEYLRDLNISALWISPIYTSPMVDFGYDISDFTDVDPTFGSLSDFDRLIDKAKSLGLRVILDFVPNHSSDRHVWFQKSIHRIKPYDEYYVWRHPKIINGTKQPPNNWLSQFYGSAWEWNEYRQQYYLHQFAPEQPDFNYRSAALNQEMKNVLTFWMDRGVDGFRIDTIYRLFEDGRFLDEPVILGTGLPADDPDTLDHIYTKNQNETYEVLKSWRALCDARNESKKIILTEAYTSLEYIKRYYEAGSDVPFNFIFIEELNNRSRSVDFYRNIARWLTDIPNKCSPNWVIGNHDKHRVATRFGIRRADQLTMLAAVLPGIGIIYNGDEIGMEDVFIPWSKTVDPRGCNAGFDKYHLKSRDPARTPFQWDNTTSAGFSSSNVTWLPVHPNYKSCNLLNQMQQNISHYSIFKKLVQLKRNENLAGAGLQPVIIGTNIFALIRYMETPVILLINFSETPVVVDAYHSFALKIPEILSVYVASVYSMIPPGISVNTTAIYLPGASSLILN